MADEWSVLELLRWTSQFFEKRRIDSPRLTAELLLAHVLGVERIHLYAGFDRVATPDERERFRELVRQRAERCPTQYLLGECEFYSRRFRLTRDVLVPRPETELLVERLVKQAREAADPIIVDLGTGSGCIAVCAAAQCPSARVFATDISAAALAVAAENAAAHGVADKISLLEGDLFAALKDADLQGRVQFLVSNPPYVSTGDLAGAMPEVRDWEPRLALHGGPDGLDIIRRIAVGTGEFLAPGGTLILEIGIGQADDARRIVAERLDCREIDLLPDLQRIPRVLVARI